MRGVGLGLGIGPVGRATAADPGNHGLPAKAVVDYGPEDFNAALVQDVTLTPDAVADDYGLTAAARLREDLTTGTHSISLPNILFVPPTPVTPVVYYVDLVVKADGRNAVLLQLVGAANDEYACVDLTTGIVGATSGVRVAVTRTAIDGGFVQLRFAISLPTPNETCSVVIYIATDKDTFFGIVGDNTKGVILARMTISHDP
jgi:hypothetical protein